MTEPADMNSDRLHRYVDGQLDADDAAAVASFLSSHPAEAAQVRLWQDQNDALHALFPPVPERADPRFDVHRAANRLRDRRWAGLRNVAAALIVLMLGSGLGWFGRDVLQPSELVSEHLIDAAVGAHALYVREKSHAVEVAAAAPNLMTWLSDRITTPIDAPDLKDQGFAFLGGRLLPGDTDGDAYGPAAQLMYENGSAQRVTLFITGALADKREVWKLEQHGPIAAYYWANDKVTCTIVGDLPAATLKQLGTKVFEQLTWRPDGPATTS